MAAVDMVLLVIYVLRFTVGTMHPAQNKYIETCGLDMIY